MDPPLRFSIRAAPVRVRLPKSAIGYSPAARALGWKASQPGTLERVGRQTGRARGLTLLIVCPRSHAGVGDHAFPGGNRGRLVG